MDSVSGSIGMRRIFPWLLFSLCCWSCAPLALPESAGGKREEGEKEAAELLARYLRQKSLMDSASAAPLYIAVFPFVDRSGFRKGIWDLEWGMADLLSSKIDSSAGWRAVPSEVVREVVGKAREIDLSEAAELGRLMEADVVLLGRLLDYDMGRLSVGDPLVGGYKSYRGVAELELRAVRVADQSEIGEISARREQVDRGVGLDLLGRPREQDIQFASLEKVVFGSEEFRATLLGRATLEVIGELLGELDRLLRPRDLDLKGEIAKVLSVSGEEVYVDLGSENGLRAGYRFSVFPGPHRTRGPGLDPERPVGVVEVREVVGARLSRMRILQGRGRIEAGDLLGPVDAE